MIFLLKKRKIYNLKCDKYTYNEIANSYTMLQNIKYGQMKKKKIFERTFYKYRKLILFNYSLLNKSHYIKLMITY